MHYLKLRATMLGGEMVHGGQSGYFVVRLRLSETPARTTSVSASLPVLDCQHLGESTLTHRAASAVTPAHALGGYIPSGTFFRIGEDLDLDRPLGGQIIDAASKLKAKKKINKPIRIAGPETLASQMGKRTCMICFRSFLHSLALRVRHAEPVLIVRWRDRLSAAARSRTVT